MNGYPNLNWPIRIYEQASLWNDLDDVFEVITLDGYVFQITGYPEFSVKFKGAVYTELSKFFCLGTYTEGLFTFLDSGGRELLNTIPEQKRSVLEPLFATSIIQLPFLQYICSFSRFNERDSNLAWIASALTPQKPYESVQEVNQRRNQFVKTINTKLSDTAIAFLESIPMCDLAMINSKLLIESLLKLPDSVIGKINKMYREMHSSLALLHMIAEEPNLVKVLTNDQLIHVIRYFPSGYFNNRKYNKVRTHSVYPYDSVEFLDFVLEQDIFCDLQDVYGVPITPSYELNKLPIEVEKLGWKGFSDIKVFLSWATDSRPDLLNRHLFQILEAIAQPDTWLACNGADFILVTIDSGQYWAIDTVVSDMSSPEVQRVQSIIEKRTAFESGCSQANFQARSLGVAINYPYELRCACEEFLLKHGELEIISDTNELVRSPLTTNLEDDLASASTGGKIFLSIQPGDLGYASIVLNQEAAFEAGKLDWANESAISRSFQSKTIKCISELCQHLNRFGKESSIDQ